MIVRVNEPLLKGYLDALNTIADKYGLANDASVMGVSRLPDVLSVEKKSLMRTLLPEGMRTIAEQALCDFDRMRILRAKKLKADVLSKLENIEKYVSVIEKNSPVTVEQYRERLLGKLNEILGSSGIDESRILPRRRYLPIK